MTPEQEKAARDAQVEAEVRSGKRGYEGMLPARLQRLSDQITDPFGIGDELRAFGKWSGERIRAPFRESYWKGTEDTSKRADEAYERELETARAERRVAQQENSIAPELIGGLATAAPARAIQAARALPFLQRARESAQIGAGYGTATGAAQGEGGAVNRMMGAVEGGALASVAGPVLSELIAPAILRTGGGIRDAVRYGNRAIRNAMNPEQAAIENVADRMVAAGLDPAAARGAVSPAASANLHRRGFADEQIATIISRGLRNEPAAQIAADFGISPATVTRYVNAYREANPTPLNIIDIAKETVGEGGAAPLTRLGRATYSLAGDESGEAAQRLIGRQELQPGRVSNIIQRSVAGGDFEATRAAGLQRLRNEADTAYRQFYQEPHLAIDNFADLMEDPLFRRANILAQRQARVDTIRRNQDAVRAGRQPEPVPGVDPDVQVFSPQHLDLIQRQLRIAGEGAVSNPNAARHAQNLRQVFLDRIEDFYPTFRGIRRNYATGMGEFGEEGALEAGAALTTRLGAPSREALREFATMTPAQQELFRLGFARRLMDMAADPQIGGAVANKFNTTAVRELVERLYPAADRQLAQRGQRLLRDLRREAITTRTKNDVTVGARTAELQSDMGRLMEGAQTAADVATGRWGKLLDNLSTRLSTQIGRRGSREVLRILTETDPAEVLQIMNRLARAAQTTQERQAYVTAIRELRAMGIGSLTSQA
ncbi:MAG TPA: hypothetical protein VJ437_12360, partial [Acidiferrobacterales bacterium]|nr:hypothetical protein [Acidiferrobacterales bacterium]